MKSVTIKDKSGKVLIKVIHRKSGVYDLVKRSDIAATIEVRDDNNRKVAFK